MVNPNYREYIVTDYEGKSAAEKTRIEKNIILSIPLKADSVALETTNTTKVPEEEPFDLSPLEGHMSTSIIENLEQKVKRLKGKMRDGFHGPKSRIFGSENGKDIYAVHATNGSNYTCTCTMYKTYSLCSHSLATAHDNKCLQDFLKVALKKPNNITPPATSGASKNAGKKTSQRSSRKRKSTSTNDVPPRRETLGEILARTEADEEIATGNFGVINSSSLKMKIVRGGASKRPKYFPTTTTPFELIDIRGNIRICAGCKGRLIDGPASVLVPHDLDSKICIRHQEKDHVYIDQRKDWVQKFDNKHYHVSLPCLKSRNPHFNKDDLHTHLLDMQQLNYTVKQFLVQRLS